MFSLGCFFDFILTTYIIGISKIDSIVIVSQSSPEGVYEHNLMLSRNRANTMRKYILGKHPELKDILLGNLYKEVKIIKI